MAPLVALHCCKNLGYLNYRVDVNESYDYETSNRTSTLSVARRSQPRPQRRRLPCNVVARHRFKRINLNRLHLNAVKQKNQDSQNEKEEKEKEGNAPQFTVKSTALDRKKHQYAHYREYELHRQVHDHSEHMAERQQELSLGPANDDSPNDPNPRLAVDMDQTRRMGAATQSAHKFKSLQQKVNKLSLYIHENNG